MKPFDDLADPLGPPPGDALGIVLARARRRRVTRRALAAGIGAVAVVAIAASANALAPTASPVRAVSSRPSTPATRSTIEPTPTSTTSTTSTTRPLSRDGLWFGRRLTITPRSLGAVQVGMTLLQAQTAAGLAFDGAADGAYYPTTLPDGYPHLFVAEVANGSVGCVGAELGLAESPQTVWTPEGFRLGGSVQELKALYGSRARYSPAPSSGISPRAGYVVTEPDGNLAFYVDSTNTRVLGIKAGGHDLTPSSCSG